MGRSRLNELGFRFSVSSDDASDLKTLETGASLGKRRPDLTATGEAFFSVQRQSLRSIARPARAPAPAPRMAPSVRSPRPATWLPSRPPAIAPMIVPVEPLQRWP